MQPMARDGGSRRETPPPGFAGERLAGPLEVPPHGEAQASLAFVPPSRGSFVFGDIGVRTLGPLGLAFRQSAFPCSQRCAVYPDITAVRGYALLARRGKLQPASGPRPRALWLMGWWSAAPCVRGRSCATPVMC